MAEKIYWLFAFVGLYWAYCMFWGVRGARRAKTASDYFVAGRQISTWVFVLAATATSFSGWTFVGHPGLVYRDGFQYAYASFYAIAIPFTGVLFLKRQWMLGKRYGYVTPGEMLADYFRGDGIRILTVLVALLFSIPYLGIQLRASGFLFNVLSDGLIPIDVGMWVLSAVVMIYVASGGLRAVAYVDTVQCLLLAAGMVIVGLIALDAVGGWSALREGMAALARGDAGPWGRTADGHNAYFAIPGVIQYTAGFGKETPIGGLWTGVMVLTYLMGMMGIQSAPAFTMWAFGNNNPRPFAPQQVWASSLGIGAILIFFTAIQGMGANLLGAMPDAHRAVTDAGVAIPALLPDLVGRPEDELVPLYINLIGDAAPWLVGLLAVCALAAMQSTVAAYMSTAGGMLTRDLYKRYLNPRASHTTQKLFGRIGVLTIVLSALIVATLSTDALVLLGGLAVAFGFQMWPSLAGVTWFPWITRAGATWGLAAGLLAVSLTEDFGLQLFALLGLDPPWGRWPLTIHSAGWGMAFNLLVCLTVSALTQDAGERAHRMKYHDFLRAHAALPLDKRKLVPLAWLLAVAWLFFAIGPGAVFGNDLFGAPDAGIEGWTFGIPSIWAWQILFWGLGVGMMWFLAYKMEMSTVPAREVEALTDDFGDGFLDMEPSASNR